MSGAREIGRLDEIHTKLLHFADRLEARPNEGLACFIQTTQHVKAELAKLITEIRNEIKKLEEEARDEKSKGSAPAH